MEEFNSSDVVDNIVQNTNFNDITVRLLQAAPQPRTGFYQDLEQRLSEQLTPIRATRPRMMRPRRIGIVAIAVILLFATTVAAFALHSLTQQAINMDKGLAAVEGHILNLSQTIDGYTVNLVWAHADVNRISVGIVVTNPEGFPTSQIAPNSSFALSDNSGNTFPLQTVTGTGVEAKEQSAVYSFTSSNVASLPQNLSLRLTANLSLGTSATNSVHLSAPIIFDFTVPLDKNSSTVNSLPQTVTNSNIAITLQSVQPSSSETALTFCFHINDVLYGAWTPIFTIAINGNEFYPANKQVLIEGGGNNGNCQRLIVHAPLESLKGQWRLTLTQLLGNRSAEMDETQMATLRAVATDVHTDGSVTGYSVPFGGLEQAGLTKRITGLWQFTFTVK